jgi:hypothetical protein
MLDTLLGPASPFSAVCFGPPNAAENWTNRTLALPDPARAEAAARALTARQVVDDALE